MTKRPKWQQGPQAGEFYCCALCGNNKQDELVRTAINPPDASTETMFKYFCTDVWCAARWGTGQERPSTDLENVDRLLAVRDKLKWEGM